VPFPRCLAIVPASRARRDRAGDRRHPGTFAGRHRGDRRRLGRRHRGRGGARRRACDHAAVQPRHRQRRADGVHGRPAKATDAVAIQVDGDGQHPAAEINKLVAALGESGADIAIGSRFVGERHYRAPFARRIGIAVFARVVSAICGTRITDTTSGFRAGNRRAIALFAAAYPHDYPEVEAVIIAHRAGLKIIEVPVQMRERQGGRSSITPVRSAYYMLKVLLAVAMLLPAPRQAPGESTRVTLVSVIVATALLQCVARRAATGLQGATQCSLATGLTVLILAAWRPARRIADVLDIVTPANALFVVALGFFLAVMLPSLVIAARRGAIDSPAARRSSA
jgi:hypothetical protein